MGWNGSNGNTASMEAVRKPANGLSIAKCAGIAVVAAVVIVLVVVLLFGDKSKPDNHNDRPAAAKADIPIASRRPARKAMPNKPKLKCETVAQFSGQDLKWAEAIQSALDDNDWERTLKAARDAMASTNAEVRINAVEALGWFGEPALPELTVAMADADEGVRQTAGNCFEQALNDVESSASRFDIAMSAFGAIRSKDQLVSLGGVVTSAANDFIDSEENEEKASANRIKVIKALAGIIGTGVDQNSDAAKEAYNDITGHEWRGVDEAEKYLNDPENYDSDNQDPGTADGVAPDEASR